MTPQYQRCMHNQFVACTLSLGWCNQVLPLKEACGRFLFDLLSETALPTLIELSERYGCTSLRQLTGRHLALNYEALLEAGVLWSLPHTAGRRS